MLPIPSGFSRKIIPATLSILALATPIVGAQAADDGRLEEVLVSARRVTESLQDVPTSVTAITKNTIESMQIDGFLTVGQTVPNLYIQRQGGSPIAPQMQIRGVSNGSLNHQVDSGIGLYIDGVYLGRSGAASFELADLERVEVLRGPQGTLFGRNSTGGAINLITAKPSGEMGGEVQLGVGNYNSTNIRAMLDLPEWNGFSARFNILKKKSDGDVDNTAVRRTFAFPEPFGDITTASRGGDNDTDGFLAAIRYQGIERLTIDYKYDRSKWTGTKNFRQVGNIGPCVDFESTTGQCAFLTPGLLTEVTPLTLSFDYEDKLANPLETEANLDVEGHALNVEFEINDYLTAKYIFGHREFDADSGGNQVWGAHEHLDTYGTFGNAGGVWTPLFALRQESQKQDSHEFQLLGSYESLDWIVGAFSFQEEGEVNNPILLFKSLSEGSVNPISVAGFDYFVGQNLAVKNESEALYAHFNYQVSSIEVGAGVRYTKDDREEYIVAAGLYGAIIPGDQTFKTDSDNTDYDFSLTYNINDSSNMYYKYATGYVSAGTLMGNSFDAEKAKSHEIGIKTDLLDSRLRVNAAVFSMERTDTQIEGFTGIGYFMGKGDYVDSEGVELEITYLPTARLSLNFNYGYNNVDMSGDLRTFQPKQTAYFGGEYDFPEFGNGIEPSFRVDVSWRDDVYRLACTAGTDQIPATDTCVGTPDLELDAKAELSSTTMLGMVLSFDSIKLGQMQGKVSLWGRNLLDENEKEFGFTLGGPTLTNTFVRPRTYGIDLQVTF